MKTFIAAILLMAATANAETIRHFVAFRYRSTVTAAQRAEVHRRFLALKDLCRTPDGRRYVVSIEAGPANSPEKADQGLQEAYIVTFASAADRNYYVGRPFFSPFEPAHDAFKAFVAPLLDANGAFVFDFPVEAIH